MLVPAVGVLTGFSPPATVQRLVVQPSSQISIHGHTNVNKFQCAISQYSGTDTLVLRKAGGTAAAFSRGMVKLSSTSFDCGLWLMTRDFRKAIKADEFSYIEIDFVSFEHLPLNGKTEESLTGNLNISLSGVIVPAAVKCNFRRDEKGFIHLIGSHQLMFSDFNLQPPTKMMGLVRVNNHIAVDFHLVLSQL